MPIETVINFSIFGIVSNFAFILLSTLVTAIKIKKFSNTQLRETIAFSEMRANHILETTTSIRRLLHFLLVFIPTYSVYINVVFLYYLFVTNAINPVIKATMMADNASILPLARFRATSIDK